MPSTPTATAFNAGKIAFGPGRLWANVAIPTPGNRIAIATDGTPDSITNPAALHLGYTKAGAKYSVKPTFEKFYADEIPDAIIQRVGQSEAMISAELLQAGLDLILLALLSQGVGTYSTGTGFDQVTIGQSPIVYTSLALIFPTTADPTKYAVFHLYRAINEEGFETTISRKEMGSIPVTFKGVAIPERVATDAVANRWNQTV